MTNETAFDVPLWLDPFSDDVSCSNPPLVQRRQLDMAGQRIFSEPLVAQRLITFARAGLTLDEPDNLHGLVLPRWGHSLTSAIAVLMPPADLDAKAKRERRKYQEQLLTAQTTWPDLASSRNSAFLLCADHKPPEYGLPKQFYSRHTPESLLSWDSVPPLLTQFIHAVSPVAAPAWIEAKSALREALVTIFAETFKNTHDHAREDIDGSSIQMSVRSLYSRFYSMSDALNSISLVSAEHVTQVERYVRSFVPRAVKPGVRAQEQTSVSGFLEVSISDSGPGMAARWLRRPVHNVDPKEQLEAVLQCFGKGHTTSGTLGRGFGLWKVLLSLTDLRGFISVRTNNIHAFRQFGYALAGQDELPNGRRVPKEQLYDWKRGLSTVPSTYPHVQGTVISILLPMGAA